MTDILFRAWNKIDQQMEEMDLWWFYENGIHKWPPPEKDKEWMSHTWDILEYSGKYDIRHTRICEGDIVQDHQEKVYLVIRNDGGFIIKSINGFESDEFALSSKIVPVLRIIGNKFQQPEICVGHDSIAEYVG